LTNLAPAAGNILSVTIGGATVVHTVGTNATPASIINWFANTLNNPDFYPPGNLICTKYGDRLELRLSGGSSGAGVTVGVSNAPGAAPALNTFLRAARPSFLDSITGPENPYDHEPRNHLYVTLGATNLALAVPFDTTTLPDGFHELTAVAYEGTSVRTQTRATVPVRIQNTPLVATLTLSGAGAVTAVETNFTVEIVSPATNVALIELFTTGGRLATATNQSSASFPVSGEFLGVGAHPLFALVTSDGGQRFRTATTVVRLVGPEAVINAAVAIHSPLRVAWAGAVGRRYQILSAPLPAGPYLFREAVTASNSFYNFWLDPALPAGELQRYYRVGLLP
jgi:hypothetical protein